MAINIEDAKKLAKTCNLDFNQAELMNITMKINDILEEVKKLDLLEEYLSKDKQIEENIFREDEQIESLSLEEVFKNTRYKSGDYFGISNNNREGC